MLKKLAHIVGNRPQFIKLAPFLRATALSGEVNDVIIHSGQHYDFEMSRTFFEEFEIPKPDYNLGIGSGTHAEQTGAIMTELEPLLQKEQPHFVIVYGDTNTTLAEVDENGYHVFGKKMPKPTTKDGNLLTSRNSF